MTKPSPRDRLAQAAFDLFEAARRRYALTSTVPALRDREIAAVAAHSHVLRLVEPSRASTANE